MKQLVDLQPLQGLLGGYLCAKLQLDGIWILLSQGVFFSSVFQTIALWNRGCARELALKEGLPIEAVFTEECIVPLVRHSEWTAF